MKKIIWMTWIFKIYNIEKEVIQWQDILQDGALDVKLTRSLKNVT